MESYRSCFKSTAKTGRVLSHPLANGKSSTTRRNERAMLVRELQSVLPHQGYKFDCGRIRHLAKTMEQEFVVGRKDDEIYEAGGFF